MAEYIISGLIGEAIGIAIEQILKHVGIAVHCKEELNALRGLVSRIERIKNTKRGAPIAESGYNSSQWVSDLHGLLQRAQPIVEKCTIRTNIFAKYQMSKDISKLISEIKEHLEVIHLVILDQQTVLLHQQTVLLDQFTQMYAEMRRERSTSASTSQASSTTSASTGSQQTVLLDQFTQMYAERRRESSTSASTSQASSTTSASTGSFIKQYFCILVASFKQYFCILLASFKQYFCIHWKLLYPVGQEQAFATRSFFMEESLIVGQEQAFATLEKLVIDAKVKSLFRTGVVGKGGSGKTLLLKRVFNSQKVRELFRDDLLLWLTISSVSPSFSSLRNELVKQIAGQTKVDHDPNMNVEDVKTWLTVRMKAKRFALFLDDVRGKGSKLLEELGLSKLTEHSNSKIIVSSRNLRALIEMGIADPSPLAMKDLSEEQSWELFAHHAFPYNNGNPPENIDERTAKLVCDKCGGLPLAIKAIGRTMADITDAQEWELAILRLTNANSNDHQALQDRLRRSYDALGDYDVNLQLCFLYLAAFIEDQIIDVWKELIPLWIGEGLLENERGHDPFEMGRIYANVLADRCLIEPVLKDADGRVVRCRMHDILRGLAIQIAEQEENFCCRTGNGLTALVESEYSGCTRLFLNHNKLSSLPNSSRVPEMCSLLMLGNSVTEIPGRVIESMINLKVLDLSFTSLESLPKRVKYLKQLTCLILVGVPIKRLPRALTNLASLQILNLRRSKITELPSSIHKLRSLCYLDLSYCHDLQCLPLSISRLTSLQHLDMTGCGHVWITYYLKKAASINDLGCLTQLKGLRLENRAERISEGTLGSMVQMETLQLYDTMMESLPRDMMNMSKLKILDITCPDVVKMDSRFREFQKLIYVQLCCYKLEELSDLQELKGLRQLHIYGCSKLKKFPTEFGEKGAFPSLEKFSLVELDELEELPVIMEKDDVMPSLKIFTIMKCEALKMLPENYLHLKTLQKNKNVWLFHDVEEFGKNPNEKHSNRIDNNIHHRYRSNYRSV